MLSQIGFSTVAVNQRQAPYRRGLAILSDQVEVSTRKCWLGRQDSNLGMPVPKTGALPLGDAPKLLKQFYDNTRNLRKAMKRDLIE
jgi:hypothetical protein